MCECESKQRWYIDWSEWLYTLQQTAPLGFKLKDRQTDNGRTGGQTDQKADWEAHTADMTCLAHPLAIQS